MRKGRSWAAARFLLFLLLLSAGLLYRQKSRTESMMAALPVSGHQTT